MCKPRSTFTTFAIGITLLGLVSATSGQSNQPDSLKQQIVAERSNDVGTRSVIAVDQDGIVHEIDFGLRGTKDGIFMANLGSQTTRSGNLDLTTLLPKNKVATAARRITLDNGLRIHAIVAWGFPSFPDVYAPYCSLYIYKEQDGSVEKVFSDEDFGIQLEQFVVEDFSRDGRFEILFSAREAATETMSVYQIQRTGEISKIQSVDGYHVHTIADRWMDQDAKVVVEEKMQRSIPGRVCYKTEAYTWSKTANKFVKTSR